MTQYGSPAPQQVGACAVASNNCLNIGGGQLIPTNGTLFTTINDYAALVSEFKEQGALEILLQCGNFAYMNRFTDGLRLPSEDEAIKTYQETYGKSFEELRKAKRDMETYRPQ